MKATGFKVVRSSDRAIGAALAARGKSFTFSLRERRVLPVGLRMRSEVHRWTSFGVPADVLVCVSDGLRWVGQREIGLGLRLDATTDTETAPVATTPPGSSAGQRAEPAGPPRIPQNGFHEAGLHMKIQP